MLEGGHHGGGAAEGVEDGVAGEGEHLDEARGQFQRERRGVLLGGGTGDGPELLESFVEFILGEQT